VVFDLDGVLLDSEDIWESARRTTVSGAGGVWPAQGHRAVMGMSTREWANHIALMIESTISPEHVAASVIGHVLTSYRTRLPLMPGAVAAVRRIAERWPVGLATSSPPEVIGPVLEVSGLVDVFDAVVSSDDVGRGKPSPDVYLAAAGKLAVRPEACVAVEDSSNGIKAAYAGGFRVIAIPHADYPVDPLAMEKASLVLPAITDLTQEVVGGLV
jgi:HAD superfamily hydrolase (TIGR01509 family)